MSRHAILLFAVLFLRFVSGEGAATFTVVNRCGDTIWPGVLSSSGSSPLESTGFELAAGESRSLFAPSGWSGRFWARTGCVFDAYGNGNASCGTGDCGTGRVECSGSGAAPPATLVEFTLGGEKDFYDVSLVDGYNLPVAVEAAGGECPSTGCAADINRRCPAELRAGDGAACRSACDAFRRPEFCCSGEYGNPETCRPSAYAQMFKAACPQSYSYAFDDATSTFTCAAAASAAGGGAQAYSITFCPESSPSKKSTKNSTPPKIEGGEEEGEESWLASLAVGNANRSRITRRKEIVYSIISLFLYFSLF